MRLLLLLFCFASFAQAQKTVSIGILSDKLITEPEDLVAMMQNEIKAVVGEDATIIFKTALENNFSKETAKQNYLELLQSNTDIILAFGVVNSIILHQETNFPKPTIVFGTVNRDFINLPVEQKTSGQNNITYLIAPLSYKEDLSVFKTLYDYKKIGIIVDEFLPKTLPVQALFDTYFEDLENEFTLIPITATTNWEKELQGIDAVYLAGGFYLSDVERKALINTINAKKLPSFSAFDIRDVENGILATNQPDTNTEQFFRRIALGVEDIIAGKNPSELPMYIEYKRKLSINFTTASEIDFQVRYSMLGTVNFIGEATTVNSEVSLSIMDIMNGILNKNLDLQVEKKSVALARQEVKTAKSTFLPDVTANANAIYVDPELAKVSNGLNPEFSTTGNIAAQQLLYSENAVANIAIQKKLEKAQEEIYNTAELDAIFNACNAYFSALILKTNAKIQNQNLQITKRNLELAEQNFDAGATGKSDVLRFRSQLAQNTQSLIQASNAFKQSLNTINQLLNNKISNPIDLEDAELSEGVFKEYNYQKLFGLLDDPKIQTKLIEFLVQEAKINAPELKTIDYNIDAVDRNYKLNGYGRLIPTIALQGQYNHLFSQSGEGVGSISGVVPPDSNYNVGLNISLPIFQQNRRNINRQTAKIQGEQLNTQKENIALLVEKNVNDVVLELVNQISNIQISKIAEETAKESLDLTQNAYENGAIPVIQLIDAQTNYLQSQLASATANYNYLITSMQLERSIGYFFLMHSENENSSFTERAMEYILNKK